MRSQYSPLVSKFIILTGCMAFPFTAFSGEMMTLVKAAELAAAHINSNEFEGEVLSKHFIIRSLSRVVKLSGEVPYAKQYDPKIAWRASLMLKADSYDEVPFEKSDAARWGRLTIAIHHDGTRKSLAFQQGTGFMGTDRIIVGSRSTTQHDVGMRVAGGLDDAGLAVRIDPQK